MKKTGHETFDTLAFRLLRSLRHFDEALSVKEIAGVMGEPYLRVTVTVHSAARDGHVERVWIPGDRMLFRITDGGRKRYWSIVREYQAQVDRDFASFAREAA